MERNSGGNLYGNFYHVVVSSIDNLGLNSQTLSITTRTGRDKVKDDILMAMYRSVDRQNQHIVNYNWQSAEAEKWLQVNLRHSFNEVT